MVLAITSATWAGIGASLKAQIAAIQQQGVVFFAVGGDELVHDAATGADKLVLRPLAEPRQHRARVADANQRQTASAVATSRAAR